MSEKIGWISFSSIESNTFVGKESSCEFVTVNNSENSSVDIEILTNIEVAPCVIFGWIIWMRELVSFEENTLWDSRVLNSWFNNVNGVIIKIIVDDALSHSEVLVWIFNNWFLIISVE